MVGGGCPRMAPPDFSDLTLLLQRPCVLHCALRSAFANQVTNKITMTPIRMSDRVDTAITCWSDRSNLLTGCLSDCAGCHGRARNGPGRCSEVAAGCPPCCHHSARDCCTLLGDLAVAAGCGADFSGAACCAAAADATPQPISAQTNASRATLRDPPIFCLRCQCLVLLQRLLRGSRLSRFYAGSLLLRRIGEGLKMEEVRFGKFEALVLASARSSASCFVFSLLPTNRTRELESGSAADKEGAPLTQLTRVAFAGSSKAAKQPVSGEAMIPH